MDDTISAITHAGRRTFTTRALDLGMASSMIRAVTGHTTSKMMENYVKFDKGAKKRFMDDIDDAAASDCNAEREPSNVYDLTQSKKDEQLVQRMLGIPAKDKCHALLAKDPVFAVVHLAVVLWNLDSAASASKLTKSKFGYIRQCINKFNIALICTNSHRPPPKRPLQGVSQLAMHHRGMEEVKTVISLKLISLSQIN